MMVSIIWTWRFNPLSVMFHPTHPISQELRATMRRVFAQALVVKLYSDPYHRVYEYDELGQWADDGGKND